MTAVEHRIGSGTVGISAIVLWEIAKLTQLGRISVDLPDGEFSRTSARVHVWPLDLAICRTSTNLTSLPTPRVN